MNYELILRTQLEQMMLVTGRFGQRGDMYASPTEFLLAHGQYYPVSERPEWLPLGAPKCCFANAMMLAEWFELQYVEGYALMTLGQDDTDGIALPHAWLATPDSTAYEVTTPEPWAAYFGIPFSVERADDATWWGDACVLDDWRRGHPLLKERWEGEKPLQHYTPSIALRTLRAKKARGHQLFGARPLTAQSRLSMINQA